jgi:hypothetical protein
MVPRQSNLTYPASLFSRRGKVTIVLRRPSWRSILGAALLLPAIAQVALFAKVVFSRVAYPMDIEWLEGGGLYQAYRFIHGLKVYGPPELGYLAFTHPPGHFIVLGLVGQLAGIDYAMGRSVSIAFFTLACVIVVREVDARARTAAMRLAAPLVAVAAAMASLPVVSGVYDLIRNDTLALGLVLLGAVLVGDGRVSRLRIVLVAAVLTCATYTRLPCIFLSLAIGLFVLVRSRRNGLLLLTCTAFAGGVVLAVLQFASDGWFFWLTVRLLSGHPIDRARFLDALRRILLFAPYLVAVPFVLSIRALRERLLPRTLLWCGLLAGAFPAALLPFAKLGGFDNDLIPVVFLAGPVAVLLVLDLVRDEVTTSRAATRARWIALVAASAYLAWRTYDPAAFIPSADQRARADRLNAFVAGLDGGVIIPNHPFLPIRNGKDGPQFHTMPYLDVVGAGIGEALYPYIDASHAKWAILDGGEPFVRENVLSLYDYVGPVPEEVKTMIGFPSAPRLLFRRRLPAPKPDLRVVFDFESPSYADWTVTGNAFASSPTAGKPPDQLAVVGYRGRGLANSYALQMGDAATGTLISPPFVLDRSHLALLIGGAAGHATRVALVVDGAVVVEASGLGGEVMVPVVWDVSALEGRRAQLAIVDEDTGPAGHVLVDQVELFN